jgi:NAD(P)-dependent dehydrogenase (short-subunit alcohol dehydrogenase family)
MRESSMQLQGKSVLITGSTDGVGRRVAERLAAMGASVSVHGRDRVRGEGLAEALRRAGNGRAKFYQADLAELAQVRRLADAVGSDHARLDVLINNAGLGSGPRSARETSVDGHELRFAVNYLAGFLLTMLLLPRMRESAPSRIVNVASAGQRAIDFDDVMLTKNYDGARAYTQSKLAQIMFTFELVRDLDGSGVTVNSLHPATYMDTTMVRQMGTAPISTVDEGADAIVNLAVSPALEGVTGRYFNRLKEARADPQAYDEEARKRLWALSLRLSGLSAR